MPVNLVSEEELREALRPYRADPAAFEAGVRARIEAEAGEKNSSDEPLARLSPLLRSAAALLPLEVLAGCQGTAAAAKIAPAGAAAKLLGYLAFPAISLFVLLGATIFSVLKIRGIQDQGGKRLADAGATHLATLEWQQRHMLAGCGVFAATMILMLLGATWILFGFYLVSFGILLYVLNSLAKIGIGDRAVIGRSCGSGLMFLGQFAMFAGIGHREIHFVDQKLVSAVFFVGVLFLLPYGFAGLKLPGKLAAQPRKTPRWFWMVLGVFWCVQVLLIAAMWSLTGDSATLRIILVVVLAVGALAPLIAVLPRGAGSWLRAVPVGFIVVLLVPITAWLASPVLWPVTPERMKDYVESFDKARYHTASWQNWEVVAQWTIDANLRPDLSSARRLLAKELSGQQNPFILGSGLRLGMLEADQIDQLRDYERQRQALFAAPPRGMPPQVLTSLDQKEWVIRAAVLRDELSSEERDRLEAQLYAALENLPNQRHADPLKTWLQVTELLDVIGRPIDRDQHRPAVHDWLRELHAKNIGWIHLAGGFRKYPHVKYAYLDSTSNAVKLMEIYGVPEGLHLLWTRSFLRPLGDRKLSDNQWIAAATLARLDRLPGVAQPSWLEVLYYERTLLAAVVLVGLCVYATASSPKKNDEL